MVGIMITPWHLKDLHFLSFFFIQGRQTRRFAILRKLGLAKGWVWQQPGDGSWPRMVLDDWPTMVTEMRWSMRHSKVITAPMADPHSHTWLAPMISDVTTMSSLWWEAIRESSPQLWTFLGFGEGLGNHSAVKNRHGLAHIVTFKLSQFLGSLTFQHTAFMHAAWRSPASLMIVILKQG